MYSEAYSDVSIRVRIQLKMRVLLFSVRDMTSTIGSLSMSSATGKKILSMIREGDYAHAGEEEAIRLTVSNINPDPARKILDMGCGLGGTADFISREGLGQTTGIDIDPDTIQYASANYPLSSFVCCPAGEASRHLPAEFSLVFIFNALYSFPDQIQALREACKVTLPGSEMRVFEYTAKSETPEVMEFLERYGRGKWRPIMMDQAQLMFHESGWSLKETTDLSDSYERWYADLVRKIVNKRDIIVQQAGERWYEYAVWRYQELLDVIRAGVIGGAIFRATRE